MPSFIVIHPKVYKYFSIQPPLAYSPNSWTTSCNSFAGNHTFAKHYMTQTNQEAKTTNDRVSPTYPVLPFALV